MTDTDSSTSFDPKFSLPGFNLPINFKPHSGFWQQSDPKGEGKDLFPNALDTEDADRGFHNRRLTPLRELTMMHIMNEITDKPDWHIKVFDEAIVSKWKTEALNAKGQDVTEKMMEWCIAELRFKAKGFKKTSFVVAYDGGVVKSDTAVSPEIKQALREAVSVLENVPDHLKDWHPGSNDKVLDLVHPSLFPLVYGRSRILENKTTTLEDFVRRTGEGTVLPVPPEDQMVLPPLYQTMFPDRDPAKPFSRTFQWLPCDVDLSENGKDAKITSYINNLHPFDHKKLYGVIEQIIARTIPLWNEVLTNVKPMLGAGRWERIKFNRVVYNPDPENGPREDGPQQEEGEDYDDYYQRRHQWYRETRKVVLPEPGDFVLPKLRWTMRYDDDGLIQGNGPVDIFRDYRHRGLQVIVKLANIHLTPEKPEYGGGSWHVEGQLNEHICASAIYYYDNENITSSHLSFRHRVAHDSTINIRYEQDHRDWLEDVFGCRNDGATIQELGSVVTSEDRLLAWPNVLQHQVQPFKLADPTKPGHRKILALFLVDPHIRIISTANIPCQRKDWWAAHVKELEESVAKLPVELQDKIYKDVDFPLTMEEAKELRLKLMEERSRYVDRMGRMFTQHQFSLCEH